MYHPPEIFCRKGVGTCARLAPAPRPRTRRRVEAGAILLAAVMPTGDHNPGSLMARGGPAGAAGAGDMPDHAL